MEGCTGSLVAGNKCVLCFSLSFECRGPRLEDVVKSPFLDGPPRLPAVCDIPDSVQLNASTHPLLKQRGVDSTFFVAAARGALLSYRFCKTIASKFYSRFHLHLSTPIIPSLPVHPPHALSATLNTLYTTHTPAPN